jgi:Cytochrome P460
MSRSQRVFAVAWLVLVAVSLWGSGRPELAGFDPMGLPKDLPRWTHFTTVANETTYHEVAVNAPSLKAAKIAGAYQDGTKLIQTLYDVERKPFKYQVMIKDRQLFARMGGWGFASFTPDGKREKIDAEKNCWSCHSNQDATDYVFSSSPQ